jgi:hypothetical protein
MIASMIVSSSFVVVDADSSVVCHDDDDDDDVFVLHFLWRVHAVDGIIGMIITIIITRHKISTPPSRATSLDI